MSKPEKIPVADIMVPVVIDAIDAEVKKRRTELTELIRLIDQQPPDVVDPLTHEMDQACRWFVEALDAMDAAHAATSPF